MKIIDVPQGSPEWIRARLGIPTASNFSRIVTKTGKPATAADRYLAELTAEWFLECQLDDAETAFMDRGNRLEADAVAAYEFERDVDTEKVGLLLTDDGMAGASPDRLVGADGLLEGKCPSAAVHMMYVLDGPPADYYCQCQGQLWVTGRAWVDLYCHHPVFPRVCKRYERDTEFLGILDVEMAKFCKRLAKAKEELAEAKAAHMAKLSRRRSRVSLDLTLSPPPPVAPTARRGFRPAEHSQRHTLQVGDHGDEV